MTDKNTLPEPSAHFALGWIESAALYAWNGHPNEQARIRKMAATIREALRGPTSFP